MQAQVPSPQDPWPHPPKDTSGSQSDIGIGYQAFSDPQAQDDVDNPFPAGMLTLPITEHEHTASMRTIDATGLLSLRSTMRDSYATKRCDPLVAIPTRP